jgi:hypothetical protein
MDPPDGRVHVVYMIVYTPSNATLPLKQNGSHLVLTYFDRYC